MDRRDEAYRNRQPGSYTSNSDFGDMPRQPRQWQADSQRQAGGHLDRGDQYTAPRRQAEVTSGYRTSTLGDFTKDRGHDYSAATAGQSGTDLRSGGSYRPDRDSSRWNSADRDAYGEWRSYGEGRGFFQRAGDEVASWFGDDDAARRRERDRQESGGENGRRENDHRGRGPSDYTRSDDRIREDVNERLTGDWQVDASHIRVTVSGSEVTLDGHVGSRQEKRRAEDIADDVSGVKHVQNNLRVGPGLRLGDTGPETVAGSRTDTGPSTS